MEPFDVKFVFIKYTRVNLLNFSLLKEKKKKEEKKWKKERRKNEEKIL